MGIGGVAACEKRYPTKHHAAVERKGGRRQCRAHERCYSEIMILSLLAQENQNGGQKRQKNKKASLFRLAFCMVKQHLQNPNRWNRCDLEYRRA